MTLSSRTQNALLGGLAVLAVGASGYAVWVVNQPHPSLSNGVTMTAPTSTVATDQEEETAPVLEVDTELETKTVEPPEPAPVTLSTREWLGALDAEDVALHVIGDGYSNMDWQWLQQWAGILAQQRPVEIRHWGEAEDVTYNSPITLSEGDGPALSVWSASRAGTSIADARERMDRFQGEADEPAAFLISLGGSSEDEDVAAEMDALLVELPDVPILLVIAPAGLYPTGVADELAHWAQDNDERVALIDLRETGLADPSVEQWALTFHETLTESAEQEG